MDNNILNYNQGKRIIYYPNTIEHMKCRIIKRVSKGSVWEKRISHRIYQDCKVNECAIDIGSNIGVHTISMLDGVSNNGFVIAFEPQKDLAKCLIETLKQINSNFEVSNHLVSNKNEKKLFYSDGSGRSRIPIEGDRYNKNWNKSYLKSTTLDSFLSTNKKYNNQQLPICLIKIDVEGHEFEVLEGAKETIHKYKPVIYIEVWEKKGDLNKLVYWCEKNKYNMEKITRNDYRLYV
jgi:FkbM family methyltransferase